MSESQSGNTALRGLLLGLIGVMIFGLSFPTTRLALNGLDPWFIALGRAALAGLIAFVVLACCKAPFPRTELSHLCGAAIGVIFGFPVFSTLALLTITAGHAGVVTSLMPLVTALFGAWLGRERMSGRFWMFALLGAVVVVAFSLVRAQGKLANLGQGDFFMALAVVLGSFGYACGARASRALPGWQVISWTLVIALPLTLPLAYWRAPVDLGAIPTFAWLGFLYVALMSQYIGFFFWYSGLALGGIARVSQVQLLQVFFTIAFSALLLGESVEAMTVLFALATVVVVVLGRRATAVKSQE